jgi:hypothetical protein
MPTTTSPLIVQTATRQGSGRTNQDHIVITDRTVAVLDGATSWLPQDPSQDGGWYARTLGEQLAHRLDSEAALPDIVRSAITVLRDRYGLRRGESPESTVTIARWDTDAVEVYVLSDSPAVIYDEHGRYTVVRDDRLESVGAAHRTVYREHLRAGHGYDHALHDLIAQVQLDERAARNTADGYWIAEADPDAADHAVTKRIPHVDIDAVLLLTDGASAAVDEYRQPPDWTAVRTALDLHGIQRFLDAIHALEETDPNGHRWPRSKPHDDKTLAYWRRT